MRWLLVDSIDSLIVNQRIIGRKTYLADEEFFQDHFPGFPVVPGVLIMESLAQLSGKMIGYSVLQNRGDWIREFVKHFWPKGGPKGISRLKMGRAQQDPRSPNPGLELPKRSSKFDLSLILALAKFKNWKNRKSSNPTHLSNLPFPGVSIFAQVFYRVIVCRFMCRAPAPSGC